jgi:hypothetical protein
MSNLSQIGPSAYLHERFGTVLGFDTAENAHSTSELRQI